MFPYALFLCPERLWLRHETLTLARAAADPLFTDEGRSREAQNRQTYRNICISRPTLGPFSQLSGEQDVGQLALRVGPDWVVVLLPAQVVKLDLAHVVSRRRQVDDPGRGRVLQQVQQQESQEEVA